MTISANGKDYTIETRTALDAFLRQLKLEPKNVVVERNGEPLTPSEARACELAEGDRLEIVRIVAGG